MTNVYLEKIALTVEDVREARRKGAEEGSRVQTKGVLPSLVAGTAIGAVLGRRHASKILDGLKKNGTPLRESKTFKNVFTTQGAGYGGVAGATVGVLAMSGKAREKQVREHTRIINSGLLKSAAVTRHQVEDRITRNDAIVGLSGQAGALGGMVLGGGSVAAYGAHKGLKAHGGYEAIKDSLKNAYAKRKTNKEFKVGKGAYFKKLEDAKYPRALAKYIDKAGIAREVGKSVGASVYKRGLAGLVAGTMIGGVGATNIAQHKVDKSDVKYYTKLHKASLNA